MFESISGGCISSMPFSLQATLPLFQFRLVAIGKQSHANRYIDPNDTWICAIPSINRRVARFFDGVQTDHA